MFTCRGAKLPIRHHPGKDLFIPVHPLDEQFVEHTLKICSEVSEVVGPGRFLDGFAGLGGYPDLIEEKLVGLGEVRAEAFVELVHEAGQRNRLVRNRRGANIGRSLQGVGLALP